MKKSLVVIMAVAAAATAIWTGCSGDQIFRHKVLQKIALGDSGAHVEEVLGVPDEEKEGVSFYYEEEYLDLLEKERELAEDLNEFGPGNTYYEYSQIVKRLQNGEYKSIEIEYAPWGAVEKVICNVGFNRIDMQVKTPKEYTLLDSGYLKGMSVYPLRYTATYKDGSYVLAWANVRLDETGTLGNWTDEFGNRCSAPVQAIEADAAVSADGQRGYITAADFNDDAFLSPIARHCVRSHLRRALKASAPYLTNILLRRSSSGTRRLLRRALFRAVPCTLRGSPCRYCLFFPKRNWWSSR